MNTILRSFEIIEEVVGETYPLVDYNVIMGNSFPRNIDQPVAILLLPSNDNGITLPIIEIDPNMTLAHIIKSLLNLISLIVSKDSNYTYLIPDDIEEDLYKKFSERMEHINNQIIGKGVESVALN